MKNIKKILVSWLFTVAIISILVALVNVAVQQDMRQGANDPQIQLAEDGATALSNGVSADSLNNGVFDISQSLSPFIAVYDANGTGVAANGQLNGKIPVLPTGVFSSTKAVGEDRITWEPQAGLREALVIVYYSANGNTGFVAVGRSLREVEMREAQLNYESFAAWVLASVLALILIWLYQNFVLTELEHHKH